MHRGEKFEMEVDNSVLLENFFLFSKVEEQVDIPSVYTGIQMRYTVDRCKT